jgi:hypothetical protein
MILLTSWHWLHEKYELYFPHILHKLSPDVIKKNANCIEILPKCLIIIFTVKLIFVLLNIRVFKYVCTVASNKFWLSRSFFDAIENDPL